MKSLKVVVLAALMLLVAVPLAGAQVGTWDSAFTVVNMGTSTATVQVDFYDEAGNLVPGIVDLGGGLSNPFTLAGGASQVVYLPIIPNLPNGRYSVVVSADQPISAIANLLGNNGGVYFNGSYSGAEDLGQTSMSLPSVNKAFYGWDSHMSIQNLTNAAMAVTVNFYAGTPTSIATVSQSVPGYASWHLNLADVAALPANYNGSAVVTAPGPIAVVDNQTVDAIGLTQDYNGFSEGAGTLYCPALYQNYYTWFSSLNVQNVGTVTTTVNVEYSDGATASVDLGPYAAYLFYQPSETHFAPTFSAKVTNTGGQPLVAVVNAANPVAQAQTYNCFAGGSTSYFAPIVEKNYYGWNSGVQVMNLGGTAADVTVTYETPGCTSTQNVAAGGTAVFYQPNDTCLPDGYGASATIASANPIVVIVNQTWSAGQTGDQGDWSMSYNAFGQ